MCHNNDPVYMQKSVLCYVLKKIHTYITLCLNVKRNKIMCFFSLIIGKSLEGKCLNAVWLC
jgi:hypothetical protein